MNKKSSAPQRTKPSAPAPAVRVSPNIPTTLDSSSMEVIMTYGEVAAAYSTLGFMGSRLEINSFAFNTKLRMMRRAIHDAAEDLDDYTQKLMLRMSLKDDTGEPVRDEKGNISIKQPEFDIERREYMKQTIKLWTPVWRPCELEWMQDYAPEGIHPGYVFEVLDNLGPLFTEDDECGPQDD